MSPDCWDEIGEKKLIGPELVQQTIEKDVLIHERMKPSKVGRKAMSIPGDET